MSLLSYAIFQTQNSLYVHGLTPFEILYRAPPPIIVHTLLDQGSDVAPNYLSSLKDLYEAQCEIWPHVCSLYEVQNPPSLEHGIVPGAGYG